MKKNNGGKRKKVWVGYTLPECTFEGFFYWQSDYVGEEFLEACGTLQKRKDENHTKKVRIVIEELPHKG